MRCFSVLMSIYYKDLSQFLVDSLDSILNQTVRPDEIVCVCDGKLTDELYAVLHRYESANEIIKVVSLSENSGLGKALNYGLPFCSNELVARMDADDISKPDRFEKQLAVFKQHPEYDVVGSWIDEFEGTPDNIVSVRKLPESPEQIYAYGKKRCPVNHPVVMFKKTAVLSAGGYQPFPLFEDYYLWVRMLVLGKKFYNIQESLLYFRTSPDMFRRRGGWKYAKDESRFEWIMYSLGYISLADLLVNVPVRFIARIIPNSLRSFLYRKMLR